MHENKLIKKKFKKSKAFNPYRDEYESSNANLNKPRSRFGGLDNMKARKINKIYYVRESNDQE